MVTASWAALAGARKNHVENRRGAMSGGSQWLQSTSELSSTSSATSSRASRTAARRAAASGSGSAPGGTSSSSITPPGNAHMPPKAVDAPRWIVNTSSPPVVSRTRMSVDAGMAGFLACGWSMTSIGMELHAQQHRAVRAEPAAGATHTRDLGVGHLAIACLAAEFAGGLDDQEQPALPGATRRQATAVRVGGQRPAHSQPAVLHEWPALALVAETEIFERDQQHVGERVVELAHVDVGGREPGPGERELAGHRGGTRREVVPLAHRDVRRRFASAEDP